MRYLRLLRRRDVGLLWLGATLSLLGDGLTWVALVWLVLERGGTAADVGLLVVAYTAPVILGGLGAGIVLDRFDRRRALIADNLVRGAVIATIPIATLFGGPTFAHLLAVAATYGLLYMVSLAGVPSILPSLVSDDELDTANALESLAFGVGGIAGPAIGGVLIGLVGAANVLALDAASYLAFVACLLVIRVPRTAPATRDPGTGSIRRELAAAGRFVLRQPTILAITVMFMSFNVGEGVLLVLLPILARDVLGAGAGGYGALAAGFTGGLLVGAALVGAVRWRWPLGRSIAAFQVATGVALVPLLLAPDLATTVVVLALAGLAASPLTIWAQTVRMRLIPAELRGRVFALLRTLMQSTPPAGGIVGGTLLAGGAIEAALAVVVLLIAVPGVVGLVHPAMGSAPARAGEGVDAATATR